MMYDSKRPVQDRHKVSQLGTDEGNLVTTTVVLCNLELSVSSAYMRGTCTNGVEQKLFLASRA